MNLKPIVLVFILSISASFAQGLSTGSTSNSPESFSPVPGSKILKTKGNPNPGSGMSFIITKLLELEKAVQAYESTKAKEQIQKIDDHVRNIVREVLDLNRLSQRALATYWDQLNEFPKLKEKKTEYQNLFKELVEENYLEKAKDYISGKYEIPITGQDAQGPYTLVKGRIIKPDVDLLLEFRLLKEKEDYRLVDVKLDETSLEGTYRGSFNRIIRKQGGLEKGFPELLRVMKKRLEELKKGSATRL